MRPQALNEVVGHKDLLGANALLPRLIKSDQFGSLIFYGPPGCGKTSLAEVIALETKSIVVRVNAVLSGTPELREILNEARKNQAGRTLVIIDELHRFNKTQQDLLLPDVEAGVIRLIGCTTHNPGLYVIPALLSRSHLFRLDSLNVEDIVGFLEYTMRDTQKGLAALNIKVSG
ncbi:AAA family ATPase, partial [bacterium]|nr:AAA family ATPase [bacterium]